MTFRNATIVGEFIGFGLFVIGASFSITNPDMWRFAQIGFVLAVGLGLFILFLEPAVRHSRLRVLVVLLSCVLFVATLVLCAGLTVLLDERVAGYLLWSRVF